MLTAQLPNLVPVGKSVEATTDHVDHHSTAANPAWKEAESLLKLNNEQYHVYFKDVNRTVLLHNHLAHHVLTLYALGASKEVIHAQYHNQTDYQQQVPALNLQVLESLSDPTSFKQSLADPDQYGNYLHFFRQEMENEGYEKTMIRYCFSDSAEAQKVFSRMFLGQCACKHGEWLLFTIADFTPGFIHPLIHLGFGVEFDLPIISCEALAMSCTQFNEDIESLMIRADNLAQTRQDRLSIVDITDLCAADQTLLDAAVYDMVTFFTEDGLVGSQANRILEYASRYTVHEDEIALRSAELCNASSFIMAAAQRPGKKPRMDFFLLHLTNNSILTDAIINKDWIPAIAKAKILSWFGRYIIVVYILVRAPKLDLSLIRNYKPRMADGSWEDAIKRAVAFQDDGHGCKIIRALNHAEKVSRPYEGRPEFRMKVADFKQAALATVDSFYAEDVVSRAGYDTEEAWVRLAGFDQAWVKVPNL